VRDVVDGLETEWKKLLLLLGEEHANEDAV
jgi:hypothetical protein